jgi:hypothetical protein
MTLSWSDLPLPANSDWLAIDGDSKCKLLTDLFDALIERWKACIYPVSNDNGGYWPNAYYYESIRPPAGSPITPGSWSNGPNYPNYWGPGYQFYGSRFGIGFFQTTIMTICTSFINPTASPILEGTSGDANPYGTPPFFDFPTLCAQAGLNSGGFTRKIPDGSGGLTTAYGVAQAGDAMGVWLLNEIYACLKLLTKTLRTGNGVLGYSNMQTLTGYYDSNDPNETQTSAVAKCCASAMVQTGNGGAYCPPLFLQCIIEMAGVYTLTPRASFSHSQANVFVPDWSNYSNASVLPVACTIDWYMCDQGILTFQAGDDPVESGLWHKWGSDTLAIGAQAVSSSPLGHLTINPAWFTPDANTGGGRPGGNTGWGSFFNGAVFNWAFQYQ